MCCLTMKALINCAKLEPQKNVFKAFKTLPNFYKYIQSIFIYYIIPPDTQRRAISQSMRPKLYMSAMMYD